MAKKIIRGKEARQKFLNGIQELAEAVTITLGPKGRNVALVKTWVDPSVVHDGVSVARDIELPDPFENAGVQLIRQAASKTNDKAGDGTTTSTLIAYELIKDGIKAIESGVNSMTMKKGMDLASLAIVNELNQIAIPVRDEETIRQVALISAQVPEIGKVIADAIIKIGKDGVTSVEETAKNIIDVEYKDGMEFDKGMISPQFAYNEKGEAELESPLILLADFPIQVASDVASALKKIVDETNRQEIVFIADNIEGAGLMTLIVNKEGGGIRPLGIQAPSFAERRKEVLEDIAAMTGATVISRAKGMKLDELKIEWLGSADRVISTDKTTKIVGGHGEEAKIKERAELIRKQIEETENEFEQEKLRERLARLISGAAIIKVGAVTEVELTEKKERVIDAVEATKAAVAEGVVAGGGISLLYCQEKLRGQLVDPDKDIQAGIDLVLNVLERPFEKLLSNAGANLEEVKSKVLNSFDSSTQFYGYNVLTEQYGDMFKMGVIDPLRVTKNAVENAVSVASMILTTEFIVAEIPKEKDNEKMSLV